MSRNSRSRMSRRAELARRRSRRANSGLPGYDNLGWDHFGHPASSDQPSVDQYGFDAEFGEGVRKGPYRSGPAPASVGWEPEHPAVTDELVEDYALTDDLRQENLKKAMERKAAKCIEIAESRLGRTASQREIEDLALRMMDLPNRTINARIARLADNAVQVGTDYDEGLDFTGPGNASDELEADDMMGHTMFDEYDLDGDEMISMDEWGGSSSAFDALDMDDDGMLSREEIGMGLGESFADELEADDEMAELMAELEAEEMMGANPWAFVKNHDGGPSPITGKPRGKGPKEMGMAAYMRAYRDWAINGGNNPNMAKKSATSAEMLAEEIATLKAANARLARKVRKLADNAVQVGTDYQGEDPDVEIDTKPSTEPGEGQPTQRLAKIERLAEALSTYMSEMETEADDDMASLLAELEADDTREQNDPNYGYTAEEMAEETEAHMMGEDVMGLDMDADEMMAMDPRLASIFTASDDEEESTEEESTEEESTEEDTSEEESTEEAKEEKAEKKASYRPRTSARKAAVKTLGNISREASSASDELSKLWESAPDVSRFFG
jgi:hypothetical protein